MSGALCPLGENEIHIWHAQIDIDADKLRALEMLLHADETERAARFRFPEHRSRFAAARAVLRIILGRHIGVAPGSLRFSYGEHGKPALADPANTGVQFNLSHSAGIAIYAVAPGRRVGVDVERIKAEGSWLQIARQYFAASEAAELSALPEETMRARFFELWSEKEARQKALGMGLRYPLDRELESGVWKVVKLDPPRGYAAALAYESLDAGPAIITHQFEMG